MVQIPEDLFHTSQDFNQGVTNLLMMHNLSIISAGIQTRISKPAKQTAQQAMDILEAIIDIIPTKEQENVQDA